ncbi:MAG: type II toxin-antitoxin system RelE/ParE family toxin [Roseovarius sp.]|nr:type II toxin-antitoxin system RelE/ParE family toxin [Roseovarius sp.]
MPRRWPPSSPGVTDPLWSARALASLTAQDDYLRPLNPTAADAVLSEIEHLAALIVEFPQMGRRIDGTGLRYHVTGRYRYRVIYRMRGRWVEIVEVLHPRRE